MCKSTIDANIYNSSQRKNNLLRNVVLVGDRFDLQLFVKYDNRFASGKYFG